jgi:hypothetical protein
MNKSGIQKILTSLQTQNEMLGSKAVEGIYTIASTRVSVLRMFLRALILAAVFTTSV